MAAGMHAQQNAVNLMAECVLNQAVAHSQPEWTAILKIFCNSQMMPPHAVNGAVIRTTHWYEDVVIRFRRKNFKDRCILVEAFQSSITLPAPVAALPGNCCFSRGERAAAAAHWLMPCASAFSAPEV